MKTTVIPVGVINRLRRRAQAAARPELAASDGWSISAVDPMRVLAVFSTLRLQRGFSLRAYQFRSGADGNGVVWAMPSDHALPEPAACPTMEDVFLHPPRPASAADDVMQAIDGDRSPLSYLSASIVARELAEFGALWHGTSWGAHTILGRKPPGRDRQAFDANAREGPANARWTWLTRAPTDWAPRVVESLNQVTVTFYVLNPLVVETILRVTDTYRGSGYTFATVSEEIAVGESGMIF